MPVSLASMLQELGSVVSRNLPTFYKRAFRLLGNAPDAEDAVQDGRESKVILAYTVWRFFGLAPAFVLLSRFAASSSATAFCGFSVSTR